MAIGGDQGGSIRIPCSWCGMVGLKPTWGLVPYTGAVPIETTLDHLGTITRTVEDCAIFLEVKIDETSFQLRFRYCGYYKLIKLLRNVSVISEQQLVNMRLHIVNFQFLSFSPFFFCHTVFKSCTSAIIARGQPVQRRCRFKYVYSFVEKYGKYSL